MLRLDYPEVNDISLYDMLLPTEATKFPPELAKADEILRDESFEAPFIEKFSNATGRASVPVRVFIRLMYLKRHYRWGYGPLVRNVEQNTMLKKFCRIPIVRNVPDDTTLIKLNRRYTAEVIGDLNKKLVDILPSRKRKH